VAIKLLGFTLGKKDITQEEKPGQQSFVLPSQLDNDGAVTITQNAYYGTYVDLEGAAKNEIELITRYREMSMHPECEMAIDEIVNEAIAQDEDGQIVQINMDRLKQPASIKNKIKDEFAYVLKMLNFNNLADDLFKRWYIDGRIYYHVIVNETQPKLGIQELRFIDPRKIRKVKEVKQGKDPRTGADIVKSISEYFVYNDRGISNQSSAGNTSVSSLGIKISPDSIINVNSGLMDAKNTFVISYLHKAIKPVNQLRMIEDAIVIYRISRAPERRVFYIDVGNLPKGKAEQYLHDIMSKYRNKMVYDASTGELRDDRKHLSMLEDFWLPRREGGKGTEITTLPPGQNLGELEDVKYFQKKLLQALNVPFSRLEPQDGGGMIGLGRTTEVTRDELKFNKFVNRLRNKFSVIFDQALEVQLALKGICTREEWKEFKEDVFFDFQQDSSFLEMHETELLRERMNTLTLIDPYVGRYYSAQWIKRKVLRFSEEEIAEMDKEIQEDPEANVPAQIAQQQMLSQVQQEAQPEEVPPEDNGVDADQQPEDNVTDPDQKDDSESMTPDLDAAVDSFLSTGKSNKYKNPDQRDESESVTPDLDAAVDSFLSTDKSNKYKNKLSKG